MGRLFRVAGSVLLVCLLALASSFAITSGEKIKNKGVITNRVGDVLTVKTADGPYTLVLSSDTSVRHPVGLGARHKQMPPEVLIPGLKLKFEGVGDDQNRVIAKTIEFESDDLALAEVIQAALNPVAQQQAANMQRYETDKAATDAAIEANRQRIEANQKDIQEVAQSTEKRFSELTDWAVQREAAVHFDVGKSILSPEHQQELKVLADEALKMKGYVIEVKGFADSTGNLVDNQQLSKERAEAVIAYLLQECKVPVKNIVAPGAMSVTNPVASNETASGRSENRRVDLRILVNKGVAGTGQN